MISCIFTNNVNIKLSALFTATNVMVKALAGSRDTVNFVSCLYTMRA